MATSSSVFFTGLPLNSRMMSPGSMPALAAGCPRVTVPTSAPRRSFKPKSASASSGIGCTLHADHAARDLAGAQLRNQLAHAVDRDGEADADVALLAGVGEDRGVDADHLAARVEQRAARVAGIDRGVGLQHVGAALFGDRQARARVALITPTLTVWPRPNGLPIATTQSPGCICDESPNFTSVRSRLRVDQLDQRAVGQRIAADDLGFVIDVGFLVEEARPRSWWRLRRRDCW